MGRAGDEGLTPADLVAVVRTALVPVGSDQAVVLAVSGGPDSVAMAHLVTAARPDLRPTVVHVRHRLRDDAPDAAAAVAHAQALGLPVEVVSVDVAAGAGPEDAARRARLAALRDAAVAAGAAFVLTGHTADDQAETVLLNIARGAGLPGLAGMAPQRPLAPAVVLLHPLLELRRAAVRVVAEASGLPVASDPTNTDPQQRRAQARGELLPALRALSGHDTDPVEALARLARHARRDTAALDAMAEAALDAAAQRWGPAIAVPVAAVDLPPEAIAGRIVRLLLQRAGGGPHPPPAAAVDAVLALEDGQMRTLAGGVLLSRGSGWVAAVAGDRAVFAERRGAPPIDIVELGLVLRRGAVAAGAVLPPWAPVRAAHSVAVPDDVTLHVRPRQPGDRIVTTAGTQAVADAMVDAGVPRVARELVPVVCDEQGVLWVPGVAVRAGAQGEALLSLAPQRRSRLTA